MTPKAAHSAEHARFLSHWRERNGLSLMDAANLLGCSKTSLISWERQRTPVPRYILLAAQSIDAGLELQRDAAGDYDRFLPTPESEAER